MPEVPTCTGIYMYTPHIRAPPLYGSSAHNALKVTTQSKYATEYSSIWDYHTSSCVLVLYLAVWCHWHKCTRTGYQRRRCPQSGRMNLRRVPVPCGWGCQLWYMSSWPPAWWNQGPSVYRDCGHQAVRVGCVGVMCGCVGVWRVCIKFVSNIHLLASDPIYQKNHADHWLYEPTIYSTHPIIWTHQLP